MTPSSIEASTWRWPAALSGSSVGNRPAAIASVMACDTRVSRTTSLTQSDCSCPVCFSPSSLAAIAPNDQPERRVDDDLVPQARTAGTRRERRQGSLRRRCCPRHRAAVPASRRWSAGRASPRRTPRCMHPRPPASRSTRRASRDSRLPRYTARDEQRRRQHHHQQVQQRALTDRLVQAERGRARRILQRRNDEEAHQHSAGHVQRQQARGDVPTRP